MKIRRRIINIDNEEDDYIYELTCKNNVYFWDCLFPTPPERKNATPLYLNNKRNYTIPLTNRVLAGKLKFEEADLCE